MLSVEWTIRYPIVYEQPIRGGIAFRFPPKLTSQRPRSNLRAMNERQISARIRENLARAAPPAVAAPMPDPPPSAERVVVPTEIPDRNAFVAQAYRTLFGREASPVEILHHARLLRFLPLWYTRRKFLNRLGDSWEAVAYESRVRLQHESDVRERFAALERQQREFHAQLRTQIQALQRALTEVSYEIVEDIVERQTAKGDTPCAS